MAKLYFRHGTMDSAKTLNLLAVSHNYRKQNKRVLLVKPRLDDRFGQEKIVSRSGLEATADVLVGSPADLPAAIFDDVDCVLVDEAQFLAPEVIDLFRQVTSSPGIPVICYGLRTDFRTHLFPGSRRLLELADTIEEVKVTCQFCDRKAVFNLRRAGGLGRLDGPQIQLGADDEYAPACWRCYADRTEAARQPGAPAAANG